MVFLRVGRQEGAEGGQVPLFLDHRAVGVDSAAPPEDLTVLELSLEDGAVDEEQFSPSMHFSVPHVALVPGPNTPGCEIGGGVEYSPAIGFVEGPLAVVLYFSVGEVEESFSVHHIIFPPPFVVAVIIEDIFPLPVFEIIFFLADVLVAIGVDLVHVDELLLLLDGVFAAFAKLAIGH